MFEAQHVIGVEVQHHIGVQTQHVIDAKHNPYRCISAVIVFPEITYASCSCGCTH